jgi:hypothetical protein
VTTRDISDFMVLRGCGYGLTTGCSDESTKNQSKVQTKNIFPCANRYLIRGTRIAEGYVSVEGIWKDFRSDKKGMWQEA